MILTKPLIVGARCSLLSQAQVREVLAEMRVFFSELDFDCIFVETIGDKDQKTSLRTLGKTDFFTKEVDQLLLSGQCRVSIHSAKDLPEPLPKELAIAAITKGVDAADVLVLRQSTSLSDLPAGAEIATSSERRENAVRRLCGHLNFVDVRGTIGQRLAKLDSGEVDGVVVAEAALIRLGLTHLNRVRLPGETTPLQGQLAILVRQGDAEMLDLFACLDTRQEKR